MNDPRLSAAPVVAPPARRISVTRVVLVVLLAAAVAGAALLMRARSGAASATLADSARAITDRVIPVLTAPVVRRDVPVLLEGLGSVSAFYTVTVRPQVDGRIEKVLFTEGQSVRKGDVLVQIDSRPFAIQLQSAMAALDRDQAQLKNGQLNLERYKTLSAQNLISQQQFTDQQATVAQLEGQARSDQALINSAKLNLDYARITSPIDGVAGVRLVDPGNVVRSTDATGLVVVTQLDPIAVFFTLPEDDLAPIQQAMAKGTLSVQVRSRDGERPLGEGSLAVIDNEINLATATIRLKAIFPNPEHLLWPNEFVKARLKLTTLERALVVPSAAVQHGPQGTFAYIVSADSTAAVRPVTVDTTQGDLAIISKGLSPNDVVVVEGQ
ncbi:MAG TPA: efflux RND transporter periplasmic adaptor subunit, partial [Polyangiaceae bacterium]|nr:efflux RND transporter periplasmic adaptor subunit [Polyangiaceae bacterium]